jgi:hypothetical protein
VSEVVTLCWFCGIETTPPPKGVDGWSTDARPPAMRTKDHLQPVSRGGIKGKANVVLCCNSCNNNKANETLEEFRTRLWRGDNRWDGKFFGETGGEVRFFAPTAHEWPQQRRERKKREHTRLRTERMQADHCWNYYLLLRDDPHADPARVEAALQRFRPLFVRAMELGQYDDCSLSAW